MKTLYDYIADRVAFSVLAAAYLFCCSLGLMDLEDE